MSLWKWLYLLLILKDSFAWYNSLGWQFFQYFELYHPTLSWPARVLLRNSLIVLWEGSFVCDESLFSCSSQNSPFVFDFWQFNCNVSWCRPLYVLYYLGSYRLHESGYPFHSPELESSQVIISLNKLSAPFSVSSPRLP